MSGFSRANKNPALAGPPPYLDGVVDSLEGALYDANDPTTGIGGHTDPRAAHAAFEHTTNEGSRTDVAQRLAVSLDEIEFPPTRVGQRSTRSITIINTDPTRTIEIDGVHLDDSGLGDFAAHPVSRPLAPNQSVTFHVSYSPTGEGKHEARVRFFESAGLSTQFIELRGSATETESRRRERVTQLETELDESPNTGSQIDNEKKPLPDTFMVEREQAEDAIDKWQKQVTALVKATSTWTTLNWTRFLSETGGDFRVSWTEGHVQNVIGDYISGIAGLMSSNPVIEFVASTLSSLIYDALFTHRGNRENEEAVYKGVKKVGNEIEKKQIDVGKVEAAAVSQIEARAVTAEHRARTSLERIEIVHVKEWAQREAACPEQNEQWRSQPLSPANAELGARAIGERTRGNGRYEPTSVRGGPQERIRSQGGPGHRASRSVRVSGAGRVEQSGHQERRRDRETLDRES